MAASTCDLRSCFLCTHCIPEWRELIAVGKQTIFYKKGKNIFRENDPVNGIFFLYEGSAKIYMHWGDQKELIIRFAKAGDIMGYRGLMEPHVYPVSADALEDAKVCYIPNDLLEATLKTNPSFTHCLMHVYARELQNAEKRMRDLVHMEVKGRIALALLEIAELFGVDGENFIALPIQRQDIAFYAGTTYETVFKFFSELTEKNILYTSGKNIRINDATSLKKFVTYHS
jgi:CRP/FNR family transcriptional regulator